jgi:hypothetical protein
MIWEQVGTKIAYNIRDQGFGVKGRKLFIFFFDLYEVLSIKYTYIIYIISIILGHQK